MGRSRRCAICASPDVAAINAQLEAGLKQLAIHEAFPAFSIFQLSRHKRGCLAKPASDLSTEQGSREIARWLERAESTFLVAQANGDTKSAASAISTAVRTLSAMHKKRDQELAKAEKAAANPDDVSFTVAQIDKLIAHDAKSGDGDRGYPRNFTLFNEEPMFRQLVDIIWANRALLPALLATSANYIPERVTEHVNAND
jgi:hypothetical protein